MNPSDPPKLSSASLSNDELALRGEIAIICGLTPYRNLHNPLVNNLYRLITPLLASARKEGEIVGRIDELEHISPGRKNDPIADFHEGQWEGTPVVVRISNLKKIQAELTKKRGAV